MCMCLYAFRVEPDDYLYSMYVYCMCMCLYAFRAQLDDRARPDNRAALDDRAGLTICLLYVSCMVCGIWGTH